MTVLGIIPARFQSSRFPGKMLAPILGKSLIQRTYESAKECSLLDRLAIVTDDVRIQEHAINFGAEVFMTDPACINGTYRLIDAIERHQELQTGSIIVNIQGDRPCISPFAIEQVVAALMENPLDQMATPIVKIEDYDEILNPATVKCVIDKNGYALYFSRSPIPHSKTAGYYYKHIGIYAYRKEFLMHYATLEDTPLQKLEDLEQLKVLEHGYRIKTVEVQEADLSVDYLTDIHKVETFLCKQNLYL